MRDGTTRWLLLGAGLLAAAGWWLLRPAAPEAPLEPDAPPRAQPAPRVEDPLTGSALPSTPVAQAPTTPRPLRDPDGPRVRGVVLDERELPLLGAQVRLHAVDLAAARGVAVADGPELAFALVDGDARFDLPAPVSGWARVSAARDGRAGAVALVDPAGGWFPLTLLPEAVLSVFVGTTRGLAAPDGEVEVEAAGLRRTAPIVEGLAVLRGLPTGTARARAWSLTLGAGATAPIELRAGEATKALIALRPAPRVAGEVRERDGLVPIAGATVVLAIPGRALPAAETDAQGRFGPLDLGPIGERGVLSVSAPGYADALLEVRASASAETVPALVVTLEREVPWTGRVLRGATPVPGAQVGYSPDGVPGRAPAQTLTDENGEFRLPPPPPPAPGRRIVLIARLGGEGAALALRPGQPRPDPLVLELAPSITLTGRVVAPDGRALDDVRVSVAPAWEAARERAVDARLHAINALQGSLVGATRKDGSFEIPGLAPGPWRLRLEQAASIKVVAQILEVESDPTHAGELTLGDGLTLAGRVLDADGRPVAGARVRGVSRDEASPGPSARSGLDGAFRLLDLAPGDLTLLADASGGTRASRKLRLEASMSGVELRLGRAASLQIDLDVPAHAEPPDGPVEVELAPPGRPPSIVRTVALTHSGSKATLHDLPSGEFVVRVRRDRFVGESEEAVTLDEGKTERVRIRAQEGAGIQLLVRDADGRPAVGLPVRWGGGDERRRRSRGRWSGQATTDGAGRLTLLDLAPVDHTVRVGASGSVSAERVVRLRPGTVTPLELALPRGADLTVVVRDASDRPAPRVRVLVRPTLEPGESAEDEAASAAGELTDAEGRARFRDLPLGRGTLRVEARSRDGLVAVDEIVLRGSGDELRLRLGHDR